MQEAPAPPAARPRATGFVLVHAGAGFHSEAKAREYKQVCRRACRRAAEELRAGAGSLRAVTAALVELENSPLTNAGTGSNLNIAGEVECDASIMDGEALHFAAVGALKRIKNPVLVANKLLLEGRKGKLSAGRVPPCFLVGEGALAWALAHSIPTCTEESLVTKLSVSVFRRNKRKLEMAEESQTLHKRRRLSAQAEAAAAAAAPLDTVGAVVIDASGHVAAAVSSGGLAMKHPGRIGQAAMYACGCWAENASGANSHATAVSTSGCGEHLMKTMLSRECALAMQAEDAHQALLHTMQHKFINSPFLAGEDCVMGGAIVLRHQSCKDAGGESQPPPPMLVEFLWTHTTDSMCVGYMSTEDSKPKTSISRLPPAAVSGRSVAIEGGVCRLGGPPC